MKRKRYTQAKCQLTTNSCQISSLELPGEPAATAVIPHSRIGPVLAAALRCFWQAGR